MKKIIYLVILLVSLQGVLMAQHSNYQELWNTRYDILGNGSLHIRTEQCVQFEVGTPANGGFFAVQNSYGQIGGGQYDDCLSGVVVRFGKAIYIGNAQDYSVFGEIWGTVDGGVHFHKLAESHGFRYKPNAVSEAFVCHESNRGLKRFVKDPLNINDREEICKYKDGFLAWVVTE